MSKSVIDTLNTLEKERSPCFSRSRLLFSTVAAVMQIPVESIEAAVPGLAPDSTEFQAKLGDFAAERRALDRDDAVMESARGSYLSSSETQKTYQFCFLFVFKTFGC